jgi:hypothetical protein
MVLSHILEIAPFSRYLKKDKVDENTNCHSSLFKLPLNRKSHQE